MIKEDQRYGRDKGTIVNKSYIESGVFRRKFDSLTDNLRLARLLYEISKEMLFHRSGTRIEDMYWIDRDTGEVVAKIIDQTDNVKQKVVYTDAVKRAIENHQNLITLHTHPASMPPSPDDFNAYMQNGYVMSLVICHDGTIYQYESKQLINERLFAMYVQRYILEGYEEKDAQLKALTVIRHNHNIDFWEVI